MNLCLPIERHAEGVAVDVLCTFAGTASFGQGLPPYPLQLHDLGTMHQTGARECTVRSEDQTHFAAWWLEFNELQWARIMRQLTQRRDLPLLDAVRMFALATMAHVDATVAIWHAKNHYDFWRPSHAIQLGGESRIMAGYHYRFSVNVGTRMGNAIARKIAETQLLPR